MWPFSSSPRRQGLTGPDLFDRPYVSVRSLLTAASRRYVSPGQ
jgi:hypothetical protein